MKYCPYTLTVEQANQNTHEYDEEGRETMHTHKLAERQTFARCKGKDCGAWWLGRCRRKG